MIRLHSLNPTSQNIISLKIIIFVENTQTLNFVLSFTVYFLSMYIKWFRPLRPDEGVVIITFTHYPASCFSGSTCAGCSLTGRNNLNSGGNSYVWTKVEKECVRCNDKYRADQVEEKNCRHSLPLPNLKQPNPNHVPFHVHIKNRFI